MKELEFIEIIKNTISDSSYIGDDTAFLGGLAITQDTLVEDVHFRQATISFYELGQKAVAVNLSDLAAAGAKPEYLLISLSLPKDTTDDFVKDFYSGVDDICRPLNVKIVGGDITGGQKISITITALGAAKQHIRRSFAQVGDTIFVTGEHGNSCAGLEILEKNLPHVEKFVKSHKTPNPRIQEGLKISEICHNFAMMDTSDGLADALFKVGQSSGVTLSVDFEKIPICSELKKFAPKDWQNWVLFGGEDYELLACVREEEFEELKKHLKVYPIGKVVEQSGVPVVIKSGEKILKIDEKVIQNLSFNHFMGEEI